ncbi:CTLH/CRA C-terminal to lish motif domain-containing protein, partial [Jimgerdemannia flammicorona]
EIRNAILTGDIDAAIALTDALYPGVLEDEDTIHFRLRCRRFVEMMGACGRSERRRQRRVMAAARGRNGNSNGNSNSGKARMGEDEESAEGSGEDAMEVDDAELKSAGAGEARGKRRKREGEEEGEELVEEEGEEEQDESGDGLGGMQGLMREAMMYGQQLQEDYRNDERPEVQKALVETFSLLAYSNPAQSPVAHLLDPAGREPVAEALNSAILVSQNRPANPALERIFRQSVLSNRELVSQGSGRAAFLNVYRDCLL